MKKMSMGIDSNLKNWRLMCRLVFGEESPATQFIQQKIDKAPNGEEEEVLADERQLLNVLIQMHTNPNQKGS